MSNRQQEDVKIRTAVPGDTLLVQELIKGVMSEEFPDDCKAFAYYDIDDPASYYGGPKDTFLVAEKDGEIIGTVAIKEDAPDTALLRRVFVKKAHRGKGYGDMLLKKAMEFCFTNQYQNVVFRGTDKMQGALQLCLKRGFKEEDICVADNLTMCILTKKLAQASV